MSATYAALITTGICLGAAALEGWCAGKSVKAYFAKLKWPRYSAPLWVWYIIGGVYYATFGFVLYRLFHLGTGSLLRTVTITLVIGMMLANALWNYLFFRAENLFASFVSGSLAPFCDLALFLCLFNLDKIGAWILMPYLVYRIYAVWWGYGLWKLNGPG